MTESQAANDKRLADVLRMLSPPKGGLWHGGASPVGSLRGVSARVAAWKPAPDRLSIWQLTLHIAYWKYNVRRRLTGGEIGGFTRSPSDFPAVPDPPSEAAWKSDRGLLRDEHRLLVEAIQAFDNSRLDNKYREEGPFFFMDLLNGIVLHDAYHTGQIQLMKRLYRSLNP